MVLQVECLEPGIVGKRLVSLRMKARCGAWQLIDLVCHCLRVVLETGEDALPQAQHLPADVVPHRLQPVRRSYFNASSSTRHWISSAVAR